MENCAMAGILRSRRVVLFALLFILSSVCSIYGETATADPGKGFQNAVQIEAGGAALMAQYVIYYERLIIPHLSVNAGAGYCPLANNGIHSYSLYSYGLYILELRGYPMSETLNGLYISGGVGMYFANTLLDWSRYNMGTSNSASLGSVALATQVSAGWKFIIPINDNLGVIIDPEIYFYTAIPTSMSTVSTKKTETFAFQPDMAFINIYTGLVF